jgi:hypothetical protein
MLLFNFKRRGPKNSRKGPEKSQEKKKENRARTKRG